MRQKKLREVKYLAWDRKAKKTGELGYKILEIILLTLYTPRGSVPKLQGKSAWLLRDSSNFKNLEVAGKGPQEEQTTNSESFSLSRHFWTASRCSNDHHHHTVDQKQQHLFIILRTVLLF